MRLRPVTSVVPKALFPLVDAAGGIKSVLHVICEQAIASAVEHITIVVSPWQIDMVRQYFDALCEGRFARLPACIEYVIQTSPKGFGDAVLQGCSFVGDEPFLLLLGDHIQVEENGKPPCSAQVVQAFNSTGPVAMIGVQEVSRGELSKVGVASGRQIQQDIYRCTCFVEKPDLATAKEKLVTDGVAGNGFLAHCGIYIFTPEIFDCIAEISTMIPEPGKEVELADAQALLLRKYPENYYLCKIAGRAYDVGTPAGYASAQAAFRSRC